MSAKIEDLEPEVQEMALAFLQKCAQQGITLRITQTRRTWDEQAQIYAQGRTAPGKVVTHAPPGHSWHNFGRAFDVCFMGKEPYPDDDSVWEYIGAIGETVGLEWGGRWKVPDKPHLQHTGGTTLAALREAYKANLA
jgi:peptidoglycan L-alanyl-D-glutamate endopeptidase CwlK